MNLIHIFQKFPDHESCIEHLEKVRWDRVAVCPYCNDSNVATKQENSRIGRWNCRKCKSSFNVLSGTIFQKTKIPLQKWFLAIGLLLNAKKSVSSHQLSRDLDINQKSAWFMAMRIRMAMANSKADSELLQGIIEADETYIGGKPRKGNKRDDDKEGGNKSKRGRGTDKTPVIGVLERGGRVVAKVAEAGELNGKGLAEFISKFVDPRGSLLITDEYRGYNTIGRQMTHTVINHSICYAEGQVHTNSIEGFWSLVKRAYYGQHHHYSRKYMGLYIAEACYKYNRRKVSPDNAFAGFMKLAGC